MPLMTLAGTVMKQLELPVGTFAVPRLYIPKHSPFYGPARTLFDRLPWGLRRPRSDALEHRFNAFCCLLWAAVEDPNWTVSTILNNSHYDISKWPIPYRAMADTVKQLEKEGWLVKSSARAKNRSQLYSAPPKSPLREITAIKVSELHWEPPVISIRRGKTDLDRAPLDVELMANKAWRAWIAKYLLPPMEDLNDKLLDHGFTFFPFGKANEDSQPQYQRIYTNTEGFKETPFLAHGRLYPKNFAFPSKEKGWRQMTLIDDSPTIEVDVHASSLTLLSEDGTYGFTLPDTNDYYQYGPLGDLNRTLVKTTIQAVINGVSLDRKSWPASFKDDSKVGHLIGGEEWSKYSSAILEVYPILQTLRDDLGVWLMLTESDIILNAMLHMLDKGIGCLSIHDCLVVPIQNVEDAKEAFYFAYRQKDMKPPKLSVK